MGLASSGGRNRARRRTRGTVAAGTAAALAATGFLFWRATSGYTPEQNRTLLEAVGRGDRDAAKAALDAGADPDAREPRGVPLSEQLAWRLRAVLPSRPARTADARREMAFTADNALVLAVRRDDPELVRLLLSRHADPNARAGYLQPALALCAFRAAAAPDAQTEIAGLLLDAGADPNARSYDGQTPLHAAVFAPAPAPFVRLLLSRGADPGARAANGVTPRDAASPELARLLPKK